MTFSYARFRLAPLLTLASLAALFAACSSGPPEQSASGSSAICVESAAGAQSNLGCIRPLCGPTNCSGWENCLGIFHIACGAAGEGACTGECGPSGCKPGFSDDSGICCAPGTGNVGQEPCGGVTGNCMPQVPGSGANGVPLQPLENLRGVCVYCGNVGQYACDANGAATRCQTGVAFNGECVASGVAGAPCNASAPCNAGETCTNGTCVAPTPPSSAQIASVLANFMSTATQVGTVGPAGQELFGGESLWRDNDGDGAMAWHDANTLEMLVDYQFQTIFARQPDSTYQGTVQAYPINDYNLLSPFAGYPCSSGPATGPNSGFNLNKCGNGNAFNDDELWWATAYLRAADLEDVVNPGVLFQKYTADSYITAANQVFEHACSQWDPPISLTPPVNTPVCGGGIPQIEYIDPENPPIMNAITNELFFQAAMEMWEQNPTATGVCATKSPYVTTNGTTKRFNNDYLGWALAEYEWLKQRWWNNGSFPMLDGLDSTCKPTGPVYSYNQGPILGALLELGTNVPASYISAEGEADSQATILDYGFKIATAAMAPVTPATPGQNPGLTVNGILTEPANVDCVGGTGPGDCPEFKGVFMRYLGRFVNGAAAPCGPYENFTAQATSFIKDNAYAIYAHQTPLVGTILLPVDWTAPAPDNFIVSWQYQTTQTAGLDGLIASIALNGRPAPTGCCPVQVNGSGECCAGPICEDGECCAGGACTAAGQCCYGATDASGACCNLGDTLVGGACCPQTEACGSTCGCPSGTQCNGAPGSTTSSCVAIGCPSGEVACWSTCCSPGQTCDPYSGQCYVNIPPK